MRVLKIDETLDVTEMDVDQSEWMTDDAIWDAAMIRDDHAAWVSDTGLMDPDGTYALVSGQRLPLPIHVTGVDGERTVSATMTVDRLRSLIG
jgi:hypothetical protein